MQCCLLCATVYLPRHKSGRNKGFGFTTFETEEELNLALQVGRCPCFFITSACSLAAALPTPPSPIGQHSTCMDNTNHACNIACLLCFEPWMWVGTMHPWAVAKMRRTHCPRIGLECVHADHACKRLHAAVTICMCWAARGAHRGRSGRQDQQGGAAPRVRAAAPRRQGAPAGARA